VSFLDYAQWIVWLCPAIVTRCQSAAPFGGLTVSRDGADAAGLRARRVASGRPSRRFATCGAFSGETRNRTEDTTIFSRMLYQLSYLAEDPDPTGMKLFFEGILSWS
jgi:hypothetical protein